MPRRCMLSKLCQLSLVSSLDLDRCAPNQGRLTCDDPIMRCALLKRALGRRGASWRRLSPPAHTQLLSQNSVLGPPPACTPSQHDSYIMCYCLSAPGLPSCTFWTVPHGHTMRHAVLARTLEQQQRDERCAHRHAPPTRAALYHVVRAHAQGFVVSFCSVPLLGSKWRILAL